ncbi:hypothetical protein PO909_004042 [Leuciscus waleckii]
MTTSNFDQWPNHFCLGCGGPQFWWGWGHVKETRPHEDAAAVEEEHLLLFCGLRLAAVSIYEYDI